jgi:hypothetical protein
VWERGKVHSGFCWGNLRERKLLEGLGADERIILKCILKNWDGLMDWIDMAQDGNRLRALVNAVMNIRVP